jgi:hypothetical protein
MRKSTFSSGLHDRLNIPTKFLFKHIEKATLSTKVFEKAGSCIISYEQELAGFRALGSIFSSNS